MTKSVKKIKIRILGVIISLVGLIALILFLIPFARGSSANIGALTGIGCSVLLIIYGIGIVPINRWIAIIYKKRIGKWICNCFLGILVIIIALTIAETICMCTVNLNKPKENSVVVVLGCRVYGECPSVAMTDRLEVAYTYLQDNKNSMCILSGGKGEGEDISEAECMYRYLTQKGIDSGRLILEDRSLDTYENLTNVKEIMEERGLGNQVAIVTSEYHEYRSYLISKKVGLEYSAIPAPTTWWLLPTFYVRELYGILHQWLLGR